MFYYEMYQEHIGLGINPHYSYVDDSNDTVYHLHAVDEHICGGGNCIYYYKGQQLSFNPLSCQQLLQYEELGLPDFGDQLECGLTFVDH